LLFIILTIQKENVKYKYYLTNLYQEERQKENNFCRRETS